MCGECGWLQQVVEVEVEEVLALGSCGRGVVQVISIFCY